MTLPKPPHSMCITVRVDAAMLAELLAESGDSSLSKVLNKKAKHALTILIEEALMNQKRGECDKNEIC